MIKKIQLFFEQFIANDGENEEQKRLSINTAIAALLVEMVHIDNHVEPSELQQLKAILQKDYQLELPQVEELISLANEELTDATDYYQFTSLINRHFELSQKIEMIGQLWKMAKIDGTIDSHEEHYIRKIADLLFVPHSAFIQTKLANT